MQQIDLFVINRTCSSAICADSSRDSRKRFPGSCEIGLVGHQVGVGTRGASLLISTMLTSCGTFSIRNSKNLLRKPGWSPASWKLSKTRTEAGSIRAYNCRNPPRESSDVGKMLGCGATAVLEPCPSDSAKLHPQGSGNRTSSPDQHQSRPATRDMRTSGRFDGARHQASPSAPGYFPQIAVVPCQFIECGEQARTRQRVK